MTIRLSDNPGRAELSGTLTVVTSDGVATFDDLRIDRPTEGYTLRATSGWLSPAVSTPFDVQAAQATGLAIVVQPSGQAESGEKLDRQPVVELRDSEGRAVPRAGVKIRASLVGSGGAKLDGKQDGSTDEQGRVRYTDLRISGQGNFRIRFETEGLPPVESNEIRVSQDD